MFVDNGSTVRSNRLIVSTELQLASLTRRTPGAQGLIDRIAPIFREIRECRIERIAVIDNPAVDPLRPRHRSTGDKLIKLRAADADIGSRLVG